MMGREQAITGTDEFPDDELGSIRSLKIPEYAKDCLEDRFIFSIEELMKNTTMDLWRRGIGHRTLVEIRDALEARNLFLG